MAEIKIAGIMRAGAYSPNHIGNDAAIFNVATEQLRKRGCEVKVYTEEQLIAGEVKEDVVMNMCREWRSIEVLQAMEDEGRIVINSGYGIENSTYGRMTRILVGSNIPFPESLIVDTNEMVKSRLVKLKYDRCWVKRADFHPIHKEDVSYVRTAEEAQEVIKEYFLRGIERAVITKHLTGEHVKFYGVQGTPFFYYYHTADGAYTKSGEKRGEAVEVDAAALRNLCSLASEELGIKIYGGDCIVDAAGGITLIDFNDWPSFAPCRTEAATAIAKCVINAIKERRQGLRR